MSSTPLQDSARSIALNYVPVAIRAHVRALWMLDEALGRVVQTTTEPMIGQMRLTWWHERLCAVDMGNVAAEPVLTACAELCAHTGIRGVSLAELVNGWDVLLDPFPWDARIIETHAKMRGGVLFALTAQMLGDTGDVAVAGEGWAAADLALHCSEPVTALSAQTFAKEKLAGCGDPDAKPLRILTRLARDSSKRPLGAPQSRLVILRAVLL